MAKRERGMHELYADDPERAYGALVCTVVGQVTDDFYAHWERH